MHPRLVPGRRVTAVARSSCASLLPAASLALLLAAIFWLQPRTMSYVGLNLLLNLAVPIALATIAQMFVISVNDLDLSIGAFVELRRLHRRDLAARHAAARHRWRWPAGSLVYAGIGALIQLRNLPSIVVTLGMSFVWLGLRCWCCRRPAARRRTGCAR